MWTIDPEKEFKDLENQSKKSLKFSEEDKYYVSNIRGHKGFITSAVWSRHDENCVITASDD